MQKLPNNLKEALINEIGNGSEQRAWSISAKIILTKT
jgi:hypothetical protein